MKKMLYFVLLTILNIAVEAQNCSPDSLVVLGVQAFDTDPNIAPEFIEHQVYWNSDCLQKNKLLVHLVGSYDVPKSTIYFPTLAANNGFKVLTLKYPNGVPALMACQNSTDANCYQKYRQEIIFGDDLSSAVSVDANNCIMNRLEKLVIHLDQEYPADGWDDFLTNTNEINWPNVLLSGHSQGGGHAAYIAKQFAVDRVLMFASPNDYSSFFSAPAPWVANNSATPDSNYFAFGNIHDQIVDYSMQFEIWETMNLLDQVDSLNADESDCPFGHSNVLYTEHLLFGGLSGMHNSVVIDQYTPVTDDVPDFTPIWEYLLGVCETTPSALNEHAQQSTVNVFPNPTKNKLYLESEEVISKVELFDTVGRLVKITRPNNRRVEMEMDGNPGMWFVKISTADNRSTTFKVLTY